MKNILIILSTLLITSCHSQTATLDEYFPSNNTLSIQYAIDMDITVPNKILSNEIFPITIELTNKSSDNQTLKSLEIGSDIYEELRIENYFINGVEVSPRMHFYSISEHYGQYVFEFDTPLAAGENIEIILQTETLNPGSLLGALDACFNESYDCIFNGIEILSD